MLLINAEWNETFECKIWAILLKLKVPWSPPGLYNFNILEIIDWVEGLRRRFAFDRHAGLTIAVIPKIWPFNKKKRRKEKADGGGGCPSPTTRDAGTNGPENYPRGGVKPTTITRWYLHIKPTPCSQAILVIDWSPLSYNRHKNITHHLLINESRHFLR